MSNPKYQIFVSSTYEDLQPERDQVIRAVLEMGHIPVGMEMFSAADEEQWTIIARHIKESDYYVAIVGHRYGSTTPEGISYTRKEYEYAISVGVPALGFILADDASWPANFVDTGDDAARLSEFKELVRQKPISEWRDATDLHGKCAIALGKTFTIQPRRGWVPAGEAVGAEIAAELSRLSNENAQLRSALESARQQTASDERAEIRAIAAKMSKNKRDVSYRQYGQGAWQTSKDVSLQYVFYVLGPDLVTESSIDSMAGSLALNVKKEGESYDIVAHNQLRGILVDFMTLGLAEPSQRKHSVNDDNEYWTLTDTGKALLRYIREITHLRPDTQETTATTKSASGKKAAAKKRAAKKPAAK